MCWCWMMSWKLITVSSSKTFKFPKLFQFVAAAIQDFYLNFGSNQLIIANNILIDSTKSQYEILINLYDLIGSIGSHSSLEKGTTPLDLPTYIDLPPVYAMIGHQYYWTLTKTEEHLTKVLAWVY